MSVSHKMNAKSHTAKEFVQVYIHTYYITSFYLCTVIIYLHILIMCGAIIKGKR